MKRSWWETDTANGALIIFLHMFLCCLLWFKSDGWIYWSAIYMYVGTFIFLFTTERKNDDIKYLNCKIDKLERYNEYLEKKLEKTRNNS